METACGYCSCSERSMMKSWNLKIVCILTVVVVIVINGVAAQLDVSIPEIIYKPRLKLCDRIPDECIKVYSDFFYWPQKCIVSCPKAGEPVLSECKLWCGVLNYRPDCNDIYCASDYDTENTLPALPTTMGP